MLTTLATLKSRLAIPDLDPQFDALLTAAITAVSARFDKETSRTLARTTDFQQEFPAADTEILAACYPIEAVTKFELKTTEAEGWQEVTPTPEFLIRHNCVISLAVPFRNPQSAIRVLYAGGYVPPGTAPASGQTPLPADLESAAIEQIAYWFQNRDKLGVKTIWPHAGTYQQFFPLDLLPSVNSTLTHYRRYST